MLTARDVHAVLGRDGWITVLASLGVPESALTRRKNQPCPACGGNDRYSFDNRGGRGDFYCRQCGPGSGFDLLMRVHGWDFRTAFLRVVEHAGLASTDPRPIVAPAAPRRPVQPSRPTGRALALLRSSCAVADCEPVVRYLASRNVWPLPAGHALRAHVACDYWHEREHIGRFAALLAPIVDRDGVLASLHVTYIDREGRKLSPHTPRKILNALEGHEGCAVRLMPFDESGALGIGEGLETCLAAHALHGMTVWSALNAALLAKFTPPPPVRHVLIFADRDTAGLEAAIRLRERLDGQCTVETLVPMPPAKDFNDTLCTSNGGPQP